MQKPEQTLYHKVVKGLFSRNPRTDHIRVENRLNAGTPDIAWCTVQELANGVIENGIWGWLELKVGKLNPTARTVDLSHFTGQQYNWLTKNGEVGGRCWLFIQSGEWYFLVPSWQLWQLEAKTPLDTLFEISSRVWSDREGIDPHAFLEGLLVEKGRHD